MTNKPPSLFDRSFRYTPSFETNLKATFARIRKEQREAKAREDEAAKKVQPLKQKVR